MFIFIVSIGYIYTSYFMIDTSIKIIILNIIIFMMLLCKLFRVLFPSVKRYIIRKKIKGDIDKDNFQLYYQPIIDPIYENEIGFEALLRLKDKNGNMLSPSIFLKKIERANMMFEITLWSLNKIINEYKIIKEYDNIKNKNFYISMNISIKELENEEFIYRAIKIALENNIAYGSICLEIVESYSFDDLEKVKSAIYILRKYGYKIAIDDFGVKYSNLNTLELFDFDIIKLDKCFIDNIIESKLSKEVLIFISKVALITNKVIVVEGVEESSQVDIVKSIHKKIYIQGYFYSKPISIIDLKKFNLCNNYYIKD